MNVQLTWKNSTPSSRQRPIANTVIEARVSSSLPWTNVNTVAVPTEQLLVADVAPGTWEFRAIEVDSAGVQSASQPTASIDVPFDGPSGVTQFQATLA